MKHPRLPDETRQEALRRAEIAAEDGRCQGCSPAVVARAAAEAALDVVWAKLVGDARDRTATVLVASRALLEAHKLPAETVAARRRGLQRALDDLDHPAAWPLKSEGPRDA